jgi:hypothetical protein
LFGLFDLDLGSFTNHKAKYKATYVVNFAYSYVITIPASSTLSLTSSFQPKENFAKLYQHIDKNIAPASNGGTNFDPENKLKIKFDSDYIFTNFTNFIHDINDQAFKLLRQKILLSELVYTSRLELIDFMDKFIVFDLDSKQTSSKDQRSTYDTLYDDYVANFPVLTKQNKKDVSLGIFYSPDKKNYTHVSDEEQLLFDDIHNFSFEIVQLP